MDEKFAVLRRGPNYNATDGHGYNTVKLAVDDGAVVMAYGYVFPSVSSSPHLPRRLLAFLFVRRLFFSATGFRVVLKPTEGSNSVQKLEASGSANTRVRADDRNSTFLNKILNFLGVGLALYAVASLYEWGSNDSIIKHTVKCKYCRKWISQKVRYIFACLLYSRNSV